MPAGMEVGRDSFLFYWQYLYGQVLTRISIELGFPCSLSAGEIPCSILIPFLCPMLTLAGIICNIFLFHYTVMMSNSTSSNPFDQFYYEFVWPAHGGDV